MIALLHNSWDPRWIGERKQSADSSAGITWNCAVRQDVEKIAAKRHVPKIAFFSLEFPEA